MKWQELLHGETSLHQMEVVEVGGRNVGFLHGEELRLRFQETEEEIRLENAQSVFRVENKDPNDWKALWQIWGGQKPFVVWLRDLPNNAKKGPAGRQQGGLQDKEPSILTVQVHQFSRYLTWEESLHVGVDETFVETIRKKKKSKLSNEEVLRWLQEEFCLPASFQGPSEKTESHEKNKAENTIRVIVCGETDTKKALSLLGKNFRATLELSGPLPSLKRLTSYKPPQGFSPPLSVLELPLRFVDATAGGLERQAVRDELRQIAEEAGSYLQLWQKYQELEEKLVLQRAQRLGWLRYETCKTDKEGIWRFRAEEDEEYENFFEALEKSQERIEELEANLTIPPELTEGSFGLQGETKKRRGKRPWIGRVVTWDARKKEVSLRKLLDEDERESPPESGYLSLALQGERSRFSRRQFALKRLHSAEAGIPQLSLMLEGLSCKPRKTKKEKAFSAETNKSFGTKGPTPKQREAVELAINTPDIVLIQGPPGTGKTKVLTAIQARLAEMIKESNSLKGTTLLSSYQHDAVDHAAGLSSVLGLPALRFGGKAGEESRAEWILEKWVSEAKEKLQARLANIPEGKLSLYRDLLDRSAFVLAGGGTSETLRQLLRDISEKAVETDYKAKQVFENALQRLSTVKTEGKTLSETLDEKAVRGLRVDPVAFKDDGPQKAEALLVRFAGRLTREEELLLKEASKIEDGKEFALAQLKALRDRLLDDLLQSEKKAEVGGLTEEEQRTLGEVLRQMRDKILRTEQGERDVLEGFLDRLETDPRGVKRLIESYAAVYAATCQQAVGRPMVQAKNWENWTNFSQEQLEFENVLVDEAARANPLDLLIPMSLAKKRIVLVGDQRQLPHLLEPDVEKDLQRDVSGELEAAYRESLFQRLFEELRRREKEDGIRRTLTLDVQFRMHPRLGEWVSQQFYEPHGEQFSSGRPASDFQHGLEGYQTIFGKDRCAVWKDIPYEQGQEKGGISKSRPIEAKRIAKEVHLLLQKEASVSIGVITFYRAQVTEIFRELERLGVVESRENGQFQVIRKYRKTEEQEERLRVGTVDAFQGKEFDVVFLSVVRSNRKAGGDPLERRKKYGHLLLENRLCVAMSRQRKLLVVVGDQAMFESDEAEQATPALFSFLQLCEEDRDAQ